MIRTEFRGMDARQFAKLKSGSVVRDSQVFVRRYAEMGTRQSQRIVMTGTLIQRMDARKNVR